MNREQRRRHGADRRFRVEAVSKQSPDLHKLAQVFLGTAVARAKDENRAVTPPPASPEPREEGGVE